VGRWSALLDYENRGSPAPVAAVLLMPMEHGPFAYFNGKVVPIEDANVNVMTHSFNYGTGIFEGIRAYWNADDEQLYVFRMREHYDRMWRNFNLFKIDVGMTVDEVCDLTCELARKNAFKRDIYIRPVGYKAAYELTPKFNDVADGFTIYIIALGDYVDTTGGLRVAVSSWRRIADNAIPNRMKACGAYINSALAKTEASEAGFDEAIMLNDDGMVAEGSAMNLFIVRDGTLITTPVTANILEGVTRATILQLAAEDLGIPVVERSINRTELYITDELFFAGTGAQVAPITELDRRPIAGGAIGPITTRMQELYFRVVQRRVSARADWCTPVY